MLCLGPVAGQDDFFSIYARLQKARERDTVVKGRSGQVLRAIPQEKRGDTGVVKAALRAAYHEYRKFQADSIYALAAKVQHLTFPDVNFITEDNRTFSVSDFEGSDVIISYNYFYCEPCYRRIDSSLSYLKGKKVKVIALFADKFRNEAVDSRKYGDKVLTGFITEDTRELISLTMGSEFMYYLDDKRHIVFFDHLHNDQYETSWPAFLKDYTK